MIRETPEGGPAVDAFRLGRIEPLLFGAEPPHWDAARQRRRNPGYTRKPSAQQRLLAAVAPGSNPEDLDIDYTLGPDGELSEVTVRDQRTGHVIRRLHAGDLDHLGDSSAPGMLFERRG
jgi:hypothetical protein